MGGGGGYVCVCVCADKIVRTHAVAQPGGDMSTTPTRPSRACGEGGEAPGDEDAAVAAAKVRVVAPERVVHVYYGVYMCIYVSTTVPDKGAPLRHGHQRINAA